MSDFETRMRALGERIHRNFGTLVKQVADATQEYVINATPVKSGRARNGWRVGVNNADDSPPDMTGPFDPSGNTRIDANRSIINAAPLQSNFILSNNVPYIGELNNGTSQQAPEGFVEKATAIAREKVKSFRRLVDDV